MRDLPIAERRVWQMSEPRMSRVEHIGDATLYLGDCREIAPSIVSVDFIFTDPPYGRYSGANGTKERVRYSANPENISSPNAA